MHESLTSQRQFGNSKLYTINLIQRAPIAKKYAVDYIEHVKGRLAGTAIADVGSVLPQTVKHDVDQFGLVIERAVRYWKIPGVSVDPLKDAKYIMKEEGLIGKGKARDRRPTEEEIALILAAAILRMKHKRTKIPLHIIKGENMDKKLKDRWVKALLSGRYEQGKGYLLDAEQKTYCCLGVLGVITKVPRDDLDYCGYLDEAILPSTIQRRLAGLNDKGVPFEMIAGFIHENLA